MNGPRIIAEHVPDPEPLRSPDEGKTGIRKLATGAWAAIVGGKLAGEWSGLGSKARAIREAGTNTVLP